MSQGACRHLKLTVLQQHGQVNAADGGGELASHIRGAGRGQGAVILRVPIIGPRRWRHQRHRELDVPVPLCDGRGHGAGKRTRRIEADIRSIAGKDGQPARPGLPHQRVSARDLLLGDIGRRIASGGPIERLLPSHPDGLRGQTQSPKSAEPAT